jgi:hypothetical protein
MANPWDSDPIVTPAWANDPIVTPAPGSQQATEYTVGPVTGHPVAGPSDSMLADLPRRVGTAAINAGLGLISPLIGHGPFTLDALEHPSNKPNTDWLMHPQPSPSAAEVDAAQVAARNNAFNTAGVTEYQPATEGGRLGQAALTGVVTAPLGGGLLANVAGNVGAQVMQDETSLPPVVAGTLGYLGGARLGNQVRAATPLGGTSLTPETAALAKTAVENYGYTIPAAKISNNPFIRYADSTVRRMPLSGYGALDEANQIATNRNAAREFGEVADRITPDVINRAYARLGGVFNDIGQRTMVNLDQPLLNQLADIHTRAGEVGLDAGPVQAIRNQIDKVIDIAARNNGTIPGDVYQNLTKRGESLDVLQGSRSTTAGQLGGQIRDALDAALERSATTEDAMALREARTQYKALKTVEPLTMRADTAGGSTPSTGDISPAALLGRVNQQYENAARARLGEIPLKDIAQIGQRFLKEPGSSGSGERVNVGHLMTKVGAAAGGVLGGEHIGLPLSATLPALAGALAVPPVAGAMLRSQGMTQNALYGPRISTLNAMLPGLTYQPNRLLLTDRRQ